MKLSPLNLVAYFCSDINFTVNREADPTKSMVLSMAEFSCDSSVVRVQGTDLRYQVTLNVKNQIVKGSNSPCSFNVEVVGIFDILDQIPAENRERLIRVNGSSILYGAAREIIRSITSHGPMNEVLVPSVSFTPESSPDVTELTVATQSRLASPLPLENKSITGQ